MPHRKLAGLAACAALLAAGLATQPLAAGVREGVEAWSRGDYAAAVGEWQGPAASGDPDAMFNLAQAYRLGRGVPLDLAQAEELYARAAEAGHVQAADTYGLMLFQDGRRGQALPLVQSAARRGDPRAQYLLGIAHFNGDLVPLDWERAYALLILANAAGLPQANAAITQMDAHVPLEQRQAAAGLAQSLEQEAAQARSVELASADLNVAADPSSPPARSQRVPRPIPTTAVSPSIAAARAAVEEARQATGTSSPAEAGASYARGPAPASPPVEPRTPPVRAAVPVTPPAAAAAPAAAPAPAPAVMTETPRPAAQPTRAAGPWRVQLGAFSVRGNAERLWQRVSSRAELAGRERLLVASGGLTRLQAGGFATRAEAQSACRALQSAGHECLVTRQ